MNRYGLVYSLSQVDTESNSHNLDFKFFSLLSSFVKWKLPYTFCEAIIGSYLKQKPES